MQKIYEEFSKRDTVVVAISQEDKDLKTHGKFLKYFGDAGPHFVILADLNREKTTMYDRTTAYLIDKQGIVRQIFPMLIHSRPSWKSILHEVDRINEGA